MNDIVEKVVPAAIAGGVALALGISVFGLPALPSAFIIAGGTFGVGLLSQAFAPESPSFRTQSRGRTITARSTGEARTLIFGEAMISGPLILFDVSGASREFLHSVIPHATHPCDEFVAWYVNDELVATPDGNGNVTTGRFANHLRLRGYPGDFAQEADPDLVSEVENWTEAHKGEGVVYSYARLKYSTDVWPNGFTSLKAIVRGMILYDPREPAISILLSTVSISLPGTSAPSTFVTDGAHGFSPGDLIWIKDHVDSVPAIAKQYQVGSTPASDQFTLIDEDGNVVELFGGGTGGTATKCLWSNNWALCVRAFLTYRDGFNIVDSEIDDTVLIASANISDEQVQLTPEPEEYTISGADVTLPNPRGWKTGDVARLTTTGTLDAPFATDTDYYVIRHTHSNKVYQLAATLADARAKIPIVSTGGGSGIHTITRNSQLRYKCDGVATLGDAPMDVLEQMMTAAVGVVVYSGGLFKVYAGAATLSSNEVNETDLRGEALEVLPSIPRSQLFNAARGVFVDPDQFWTTVDVSPVTNSTYVSEDNGEQIFADFSLPYTTDPIAAQRILKINIERGRQGITLSFPAKPRMFETTVWDVESVSIDYLGFLSKEFRVVSWIDRPDQGIDIRYQEEAPEIYDWNLGDETVIDYAPDTNLPDAFSIAPPRNLRFSSGDDELTIGSDGTVIEAMRIIWDPPLDAFVNWIEVLWKLSTESSFRGNSVPADVGEFLLTGVTSGQDYDVVIRSRNVAKRTSEGVLGTHRVIGKAARPAPPTSFLVRRNPSGLRRFTWALTNPPLDVLNGGGVEIRYALGTPGSWEDMAPLHTEGLLTVSPFETEELAAGAYTFAIKTVDSTRNESENAVFITATIKDPPTSEALLARDEKELGWPGTLTDCWKNPENSLEAKGSVGSTWADFVGTTWADLEGKTWLEAVPRRPSIEYETNVTDIGGNVGFLPLITVEGIGSILTEFRFNSEAEGPDLSAKPYEPIDSVLSARYVQFRVTVSGSTPFLSIFNYILDAETVVDDFQDINTAIESSPWFERIEAGHIRVGIRDDVSFLSFASITALQNVGPGWTWELISKDAIISSWDEPAAEFKIYNNVGTLADAVIDIELRGPGADTTPPLPEGSFWELEDGVGFWEMETTGNWELEQ